MVSHRILQLSPLRIASLYAILGYLWVVGSDTIARLVVTTSSGLSNLQTLKGTLFITGSATLVFLLASHRERQLSRTSDELRETLDYLSLLQRLLRHNLRNSLTVIIGHAELLEETGDERVQQHARAIGERGRQLAALSEKTRISDNIMSETAKRHPVDLSWVAQKCVERAATTHPEASVTADVADGVVGLTYGRIALALDELVENAVEHNPDPEPAVHLSVSEDDGMAVIEVSDDGPGIPDIEKQAFDLDREQPLVHSQGVGLWVVKAVVQTSGGRLTFTEDAAGTTVRIELARPDVALGDQFDAVVADLPTRAGELLDGT